MRCPALLANLVYRTVRPAACVSSPYLPEPLHPGKRAERAMAYLQARPDHGLWAPRVLESRWKSRFLERHMARLHGAFLTEFLETRVVYEGAMTATEIMAQTRPLIFATPHYGVPAVGAVAMSHLLHGRKELNLFYDKARHGKELEPFFERTGVRSSTLLGGLSGVRAALRALERGDCLALLPDAFGDVAQTLVIPFFGRLLRVASGTAFLALRTRALIVPAFAAPSDALGLCITLAEPVDPEKVIADDEDQALFTLTHLLFSRIEAQLHRSPEHWRYWEMLPHVSTPLGVPTDLDRSRLMEALKAKLHALPRAVQEIPELELLLE